MIRVFWKRWCQYGTGKVQGIGSIDLHALQSAETVKLVMQAIQATADSPTIPFSVSSYMNTVGILSSHWCFSRHSHKNCQIRAFYAISHHIHKCRAAFPSSGKHFTHPRSPINTGYGRWRTLLERWLQPHFTHCRCCQGRFSEDWDEERPFRDVDDSKRLAVNCRRIWFGGLASFQLRSVLAIANILSLPRFVNTVRDAVEESGMALLRVFVSDLADGWCVFAVMQGKFVHEFF